LFVWIGFLVASMFIYSYRVNIGCLRNGTEGKVPLPWKK
jgi:glycerol-3-phosphate acyltransferase PlsY